MTSEVFTLLKQARDAAIASDTSRRRAERVDLPASADSDSDDDGDDSNRADYQRLSAPLDDRSCDASLDRYLADAAKNDEPDALSLSLTLLCRLTRTCGALSRSTSRVVRGLEAAASEKSSLASQLERVMKLRALGERKNGVAPSSLLM
mmetsp:Transcript_1365/g.2965  ORF Transcript_1365/g.2965 Transcript_1365/m.2965 type:complete len:149 (+) Transcript_1365:3-449(+)